MRRCNLHPDESSNERAPNNEWRSLDVWILNRQQYAGITKSVKDFNTFCVEPAGGRLDSCQFSMLQCEPENDVPYTERAWHLYNCHWRP